MYLVPDRVAAWNGSIRVSRPPPPLVPFPRHPPHIPSPPPLPPSFAGLWDKVGLTLFFCGCRCLHFVRHRHWRHCTGYVSLPQHTAKGVLCTLAPSCLLRLQRATYARATATVPRPPPLPLLVPLLALPKQRSRYLNVGVLVPHRTRYPRVSASRTFQLQNLRPVRWASTSIIVAVIGSTTIVIPKTLKQHPTPPRATPPPPPLPYRVSPVCPWTLFLCPKSG